MSLASSTGVPVMTSSSVTACLTGRSSNAVSASSQRLDVGRQADVELVPDDVDRHAVVEQERDQVVQALALGRSARCCSR